MAHLLAGTAADRDRLRSEALLVAIDLGFAERAESCGLVWRDAGGAEHEQSLSFGQCVKEVVRLVGERAGDIAVIIEAPLSGCFNADGNPIARDYDVPHANGRSLESGRGWYYGAGAAVALGAIFFLRGLRDALVACEARVFLFEGFVGFKRTKTEHVDDARKLLHFFIGDAVARSVCARSDGTMISVLQLLGDEAGCAPLVLIPPREVVV